MNNSTEAKYIIISPIKNESLHIGTTLKSVIAQTLRPVRMIVVDDGSDDDTVNIVSSYVQRYSWILLIQSRDSGVRDTGRAEAAAFQIGYLFALGLSIPFDYIVKLDGDLSFDAQYFEGLFKEFTQDERLGIASGIYLEHDGRDWKPVDFPSYHAAGASKVVRRECFEQIGGFLTQPGWDTVDVIKARHAGWRTRHFEHLKFLHLRSEGTAMGVRRTNEMHGEIYYLTGGSVPFFVLKLWHRLILGKPFFLAGFFMLSGYLKQVLKRNELLVSPDEARTYRQLIHSRLLGGFRNLRV
jgi:poly-beta-1,6-N-acetyl-D-glucosamine synthase